MADTSDEQRDEAAESPTLSDRLLDLFVFLPTGMAVTVAEELPRLAERGRERLGVQVNSARAVGQMAVTVGGQELKKRSANMTRSSTAGARRGSEAPEGPRPGGPRLRTIPYPEDRVTPPSTGTRLEGAAPTPAPGGSASDVPTPPPTTPEAPPAPTRSSPTPAPSRPSVDAHVPDVASLAIPGFDTLSASQVVQRLAGLSRAELVAVRAYETSVRGRRTILSRVDQQMDERS